MTQTHAAQTAPQTVRRFVKLTDIRTGGARMRSRMGILPCGILIQLEMRTLKVRNGKIQTVEIRPGEVWIPNRELAKTTKGTTTHQRYTDIYAAFRACLHASDGYGIESSRPDAECAKLGEAAAAARGLAASMLHRNRDDIETQAANDERQMTIAADLLEKRDGDKVRAGDFFLASLRTAAGDGLGRPNPPAAAMKIGAGIGAIRKRLFTIARIDEHIVSRATVLADLIEEHMSVYDALWNDLLGEPRPQTRGAIWLMIYHIQEGLHQNATPFAKLKGERQLGELIERLATHRDAFRRIRTAPYCRNAYHLADDLEIAISIATKDVGEAELAKLIERLETMSRGMRWMYALHSLHFEILAPLAILLANGKTATAQFAFVPPKLKDFEARMNHRCSDKNLRTPVKAKAQERVADATRCAGSGDWEGVKTHLIALADLL